MSYKSHPKLNEPALTQELWRYMDFAKFAALLQNKSLYFPSITQLFQSDPWEGLPSKLNFHADRPIQVHENNVTKPDGTVDYSDPSNRIYKTTLSSFLGERFNDVIKMQKQSSLNLRKVFYVSCWHMNDSESDSQWKIYGYNPTSLAIVSNFKKLCEAVTDTKEIYGGKVLYYHQEKDITPEGNAFYNAILKRKAFEHEKEFRLINWDPSTINEDNFSIGVSIAIDIEKLIDHIVISPYAPAWFLEVVTSLINQYGFNIPTSKSNLFDPFII